MKALKIISVLFLFFLLACSEDSSTAPEKSVYIEGQTYRNEIIGIELTTPKDWELQMDQEVGGMSALLVGTRSNFNGIPPSFNLITNNANGIKSASALLNASETYITNTFNQVKFESAEVRTINGCECAELIYSFMYEGVELKQKQILFLCSEELSTALTFTAGKYNYDQISAEFDFITNSLKKL